MKKTLFTLMLLMLILTGPLFASQDSYAGVKEKLTKYIEKEMKKQKIAGLSLALVDEDEVVWAKGFGYADVQADVPVDEKTVFSLASISKVFTGMAVMKLVEEGKIDLDSPLSTYIPEFSIKSRYPDAKHFTIRNMLTHHSGLPGDILNGGIQPYSPKSLEYNRLHEEMLLEHLKNVHMNNRPEHVQAYSNLAYDLMALLVERVSGMEYNDFVTEYIFTPTGMEQASFTELYRRSELGKAMAQPHDMLNPAEKLLFIGTGSGMLNANAADMGNFIKMLLAKGSFGEKQVFAEETLEKMWTVQNEHVTLDRGLKMGLSFFLNDRELDYAGRFYGHGGNLSSYHSSFKVLPDHGLGVLVTTNSSNGSNFVIEIAHKLLKESLQEKKGIAPPVVTPPKPVKLTEEQAKEIEGLYATTMFGPLEFELKKGKIFGQMMGGKFRMELLDNGWIKPRTFIKPLKYIRFKIETVDGIKIIHLRMGSHSMLLGKEFERFELDLAKWGPRLGTYVEFDPKTGEVKKDSKNLSLNYVDGMLLLNIDLVGTVLLKIHNDNECLIAGIGRTANEPVYFIEDGEEPYIRVSDFILKKKQ